MNRKTTEQLFSYHHRRQPGYAFVIVLILMLVGSLIITPLLSYMSTGVVTGMMYKSKADELYAADAGIQDGNWQVKYENINNFATPAFPADFNPYNFGAVWTYRMPERVNGKDVDVSISNVWIPNNINTASYATSPANIAASTTLVVTGNTVDAGTIDISGTKYSRYKINIQTSESRITIQSIGVWLPAGFTYFSNNTYKSTSENPSFQSQYQSVPIRSDCAGNEAMIWTFASPPAFWNYPGAIITNPNSPSAPPANTACTLEFYFYFKPPQERSNLKPNIVAWIKTGNGATYNAPYSWNASIQVYKISSFARDPGASRGTTVDSYTIKNELQQLENAFNGDYVATGKTLMIGVNAANNRRELLLPSSSNLINSIPNDARVELAQLYWTGWLKQPATGQSPEVGVFWDNGNNMSNWTSTGLGNNWVSTGTSQTDFDGRIRGNGSASFPVNDLRRYLTMGNPVNLSGATSAKIRWAQEVTTTPSNITFRAAGAVASASGTTAVTPGLPSGMQANDVCILVASTIAGGSITITANGSITAWTPVPGSPVDVTGGEKLYVWWGRYSSGSTAPTLQAGSDHIIARIAAYSNVSTVGNPIDVSAAGSSLSNNTAFSFATGLTTTTRNQEVIVVCTSGTDTNTAQFSNPFTNANLSSIDTRLNNQTSAGGGGGFGMAEGALASAGPVGTWATTLASATPKAYICFTLKPVPGNYLVLEASNNNGSTWNTIGSYATTGIQNVTLASEYLTSQFKMRFYLDGFNGTGNYVYLDNIGILVNNAAITAKPADTTITFTINGGTPHAITADWQNPAEVQVGIKDPGPSPDGYYYGCRVDVTSLVRNESNGANLSVTPPVYGNGNGNYAVAGVYSDSLKSDDSTWGSASFAGWSMIIVYSSPDTKGHQLFLYDLQEFFRSVPASENNSPSRQISGFIVPRKIEGETVVAKLTMFVGEGDIQITGDYIAMVTQRSPTERELWDGITLPSPYQNSNTAVAPRNVWNGRSTGSTATEEGVDIDTFYIYWNDGWLAEGDTTAWINLHTYGDGYVTLYMILSFRSKTTTGGSVSYLIRN